VVDLVRWRLRTRSGVFTQASGFRGIHGAGCRCECRRIYTSVGHQGRSNRRRACVRASPPTQRAIRERLVRNIALNNLRNVTVVGSALGEAPGEALLFGATGANQGTSSLQGDPVTAEMIDCSVMTLDNYVDQSSIDRIDIMKIDVEGAEPLVLRGGRTSIEKHKPCIYVESNPTCLSRFGFTPRYFASQLRDLGYEIWRHESTNRIRDTRLSLVPGDVPDGGDKEDWLAVHEASVRQAGPDEPIGLGRPRTLVPGIVVPVGR
jgi:FkbM family methyltransferase